MRSKSATKKTATSRVTRVPWRVVEVHVRPRHRLLVRFADGTKGEVDVRSFIFARNAGVFEPLRDPAEFAKAFIERGAVSWPGGQDLAPDAMYEDIKASGRRIAGRKPAGR